MKRPITTYYTRHGKPVRDPATGRYVIVKSERAASKGGGARVFHTHHGKAVRDPKTGKYATVRPRSLHLHAHVAPVSPRRASTGKLKRGPARHGGRAPPPAREAAASPNRPAAHTQAFSTQSELYLWHKANGTLAVYCRMFGIDYNPEH